MLYIDHSFCSDELRQKTQRREAAAADRVKERKERGTKAGEEADDPANKKVYRTSALVSMTFELPLWIAVPRDASREEVEWFAHEVVQGLGDKAVMRCDCCDRNASYEAQESQDFPVDSPAVLVAAWDEHGFLIYKMIAESPTKAERPSPV